MEAGTHIEVGPGRHGMGEQTYLYFREPGGIRLEINSGGYRNYQPDWQPVKGGLLTGIGHHVPQPWHAGLHDRGVPASRSWGAARTGRG
jgi:hypothetical protein